MVRMSRRRRAAAAKRGEEKAPGFEMSRGTFERKMTLDHHFPHHWEQRLVAQECAAAWLCRLVWHERDLQFLRFPADVCRDVAMAQMAPASSAGGGQPVRIAIGCHYWEHKGDPDADGPEYAVALWLDYPPRPSVSSSSAAQAASSAAASRQDPIVNFMAGRDGSVRVWQTDPRATAAHPRMLVVPTDMEIGAYARHVHLRAYRQVVGQDAEPWGLTLHWSRHNPYRLGAEKSDEREPLYALLADPARPLLADRRRRATAIVRTACRGFSARLAAAVIDFCP
jgi:hypothetical protein